MNITLRILFRPRPDSLPNIYTTLGVDYDDRVLPSITNEVIHDYFSVLCADEEQAFKVERINCPQTLYPW